MTDRPDVQLIANLVVRRPDGCVLLVRYDPPSEVGRPATADSRWWLPGQELEPYEHPDDAARAALAEIPGISVDGLRLAGVQSFRGRRGWHVSFDYLVDVHGAEDDVHDGAEREDRPSRGLPASWHQPDDLPATVHGRWEGETVARVLSGAAG